MESQFAGRRRRQEGGEAAAPSTEAPEADPEVAADEATPAKWEGLGAPHCPWQEVASDQAMSDPGPNPWAVYEPEMEQATPGQDLVEGALPDARPSTTALVDRVLHNLGPMLTSRVDDQGAHWLRAWSELEKKLKAEVACTKEAQEAVQK